MTKQEYSIPTGEEPEPVPPFTEEGLAQLGDVKYPFH